MPAALREYRLNLNDPAFVFDPYPLLAELRENLPVFYDPALKKIFFTPYEGSPPRTRIWSGSQRSR